MRKLRTFLHRHAFPNAALADQPIPKTPRQVGADGLVGRRASASASASERRCGLMGAWCGVGSRPDLRHRPRHRCAVATPASRPRRVSTASGPRQTSRRRSVGGRRRRRPPGTDDESTTATAHLSLIACRGSVATSSPTRRAGASGSWPGGVATPTPHRRVGDSAPWRQSSGVATPEQENTTRGNSPSRPTARWLSPLANSGSNCLLA